MIDLVVAAAVFRTWEIEIWVGHKMTRLLLTRNEG
jgi:hypothetical protein